MNQKTKLIIGIVIFIAIIGGAMLAYKLLGKSFVPENSLTSPSSGNISSNKTSEDTSSDDTEKVKAPDFTVTDGDGNSVKLSDFVGKPVVINFWATWCGYCKQEMPEFETVWKEMGDDVVFMMINATDGMRETQAAAEKYLKKEGFTFPVYYDHSQETIMQYGISAFPTTLFIDAEGYLVTAAMSMLDEDTLRQGISLITDESVDVSNTMDTPNPSWCDIPPQYLKISAEEAKQLMGEFDNHIVLDVRTEEEFAEKRIDGAVLIPDTELEARAATDLPDKKAVIFIYCRSGRRSESAAKKLVEMGYNHVYDFGGINDWAYDTVSD